MAVDVGFVDGTMAQTTPKGSAISMTLRSSMRRMTPTVFIGLMKLVDLLRREQVLLDLVGDDAVTGFLVREARERFGLRRDGGGHRVDDGVDLILGELREDGGSLPGALRASVRASLNGGEVAIGPSTLPGTTLSLSKGASAIYDALGPWPSGAPSRLRRAGAE